MEFNSKDKYFEKVRFEQFSQRESDINHKCNGLKTKWLERTWTQGMWVIKLPMLPSNNNPSNNS